MTVTPLGSVGRKRMTGFKIRFVPWNFNELSIEQENKYETGAHEVSMTALP